MAALVRLDVKHIAASRHVISSSRTLLDYLQSNGIRVDILNINDEKTKNETYAVGNELNYVYGIYADDFDLNVPADCDSDEMYPSWLRR